MFRPARTIAPAAAPVDLATLKAHVREDGLDSDTILQLYLDTAIGHLDGWGGVLGRCMINQTWRQDYRTWPAQAAALPLPDVSEISAVAYVDTAGDNQTLASSAYELIEGSDVGRVYWLDAFDGPALSSDVQARVSITFIAGYGATAAAVPAALRQAILLLAGHYFANREAVVLGVIPTTLPLAVQSLIAPYRRMPR